MKRTSKVKKNLNSEFNFSFPLSLMLHFFRDKSAMSTYPGTDSKKRGCEFSSVLLPTSIFIVRRFYRVPWAECPLYPFLISNKKIIFFVTSEKAYLIFIKKILRTALRCVAWALYQRNEKDGSRSKLTVVLLWRNVKLLCFFCYNLGMG